MQFQFSIHPASEDGKAAFHDALSRPNSHDSVAIHFYDSAGFRVCEISVLDSAFVNDVDKAGKFNALDVNSVGYCNRRDFEAADSWNITWKALPDATPKVRPSPPPKTVTPATPAAEMKPLPPMEVKAPRLPADTWRDRAQWRKLKKGMTKEQVRALLGEPRRAEAGVVDYWYYESSEALGAHVMFVSNRVYGWREP